MIEPLCWTCYARHAPEAPHVPNLFTVEEEPLPDPRDTRDLPALTQESGERTREAIRRVDDHATDDWKEQADDAIDTLCRMRSEFTADDVWWMLEDRDVEEPHEPRALGARLQAAARRGQIVNIGTVKSKRPVTHGSWVANWSVVGK